MRFAQREGALRLLIVGGSLGASRLNAVVPFAVKNSGLTLHVRHQAGERGIDAARAAYAAGGSDGRRLAVHRRHGARLRRRRPRDLPLRRAHRLRARRRGRRRRCWCRFPAAVDDHQTFNAQYLVREGAAVLIADRDLTAERLAAELKELCAGRGKLLAMAERARLVAKPRAAEELAAVCLEQLEAA